MERLVETAVTVGRLGGARVMDGNGTKWDNGSCLEPRFQGKDPVDHHH